MPAFDARKEIVFLPTSVEFMWANTTIQIPSLLRVGLQSSSQRPRLWCMTPGFGWPVTLKATSIRRQSFSENSDILLAQWLRM
jgi:hypothetical protein